MWSKTLLLTSFYCWTHIMELTIPIPGHDGSITVAYQLKEKYPSTLFQKWSVTPPTLSLTEMKWNILNIFLHWKVSRTYAKDMASFFQRRQNHQGPPDGTQGQRSNYSAKFSYRYIGWSVRMVYRRREPLVKGLKSILNTITGYAR